MQKTLIEKQISENLGFTDVFCKFGVKSSYLTRYKSCKLAQEYAEQNNIKYDYVLIIRPDLILKAPVIIEDLIKETFKDIKSLIFCSLSHFIKDKRVCSDIFLFAKPNTMFKFIDSTDYAIEHLICDKHKNYIPEEFLKCQAQKAKLSFQYSDRFKRKKDWILNRELGSFAFLRKHYNSIIKRYNKLKEFMKALKC